MSSVLIIVIKIEYKYINHSNRVFEYIRSKQDTYRVTNNGIDVLKTRLQYR